MKITDAIRKSDKTLFSIEILPPIKGQNIKSIFQTMEALQPYEPAFVNVTNHREEFIYRDAGNGLLEKLVLRKRPGTVGICAAIKHRFGIEPVPHIICGGMSKYEIEDTLIELSFLELDNILLLRGDPIKSESVFTPVQNGYRHSIELVKQVNNMNAGFYLDDTMKQGHQTNFCAGVAGYPEKHFEAPNLEEDMRRLKAKVDAGAEYIVTQMFFDNNKYFDFVKKCREMHINVPIIPGIKPLKNKRQLTTIPQFFKVDFPEELVQAANKAKDDKEISEIGVEWAIQQSKELIKLEVPMLHFYTLGKSEQTIKIAKHIF